MDRFIRISGWPQAAVAVAAILGPLTFVLLLYRAGASLEAIGGFLALALSLFVGQFTIARKTAVVDAKQDQQSGTLRAIEHRVNGGLRDVVAGAVESGITQGITQARADAPPERDR